MQFKGMTIPSTPSVIGLIVFVSVILTLWNTSSLWSSGERARVELVVSSRQDGDYTDGLEDDEDEYSTDYPWEEPTNEETSGEFPTDLWSELFGGMWSSDSREEPGEYTSKAGEWSDHVIEDQWPEQTAGDNSVEDQAQVAGDEWNTPGYSDRNVSMNNEPTTNASSEEWSWGLSESETIDGDDKASRTVPPSAQQRTTLANSPPPPASMSTTSAGEAATSSPTAETDGSVIVTCDRNPQLADFCILPEALQDILGGADATTATIYSRMFAGDLISELSEMCTRYEWCLDSNLDVVSPNLVSNIRFWTSDDFDGFCWPGLSSCLRVFVDYYNNCDYYEELDFMVRSLELLCSMRSDSVLPEPCIEQTLKLLHVSMENRQTGIHERSENRMESQCQSPEASMSKLLLCTASACANHTRFLYDFLPWTWFSSLTGQLQRECDLGIDSNCLHPAGDNLMTSTVANSSDENPLQLDAVDADQNAFHQDLGSGTGIPAEPVASKLVLALSVLCAITTFVLAIIGFAFWRRSVMNRTKPCSSKRFKDGVQYFEIESPVEDEDE